MLTIQSGDLAQLAEIVPLIRGLAHERFARRGKEAARFVAERRIPLDKLITERYSLDQAAQAYRLFDTQTTGKGVFVF